MLWLTACGGGGDAQTPQEPTAIERIASYAEDGSTPPTVQMYVDAGITGVTEENLDEINAVVLGLSPEDVDTPAEVQVLVDQLGIDIHKPIFISPSAASVAENQMDAITLSATDTSSVSYIVYGADADAFSVNTVTGVVVFKVAPDYEKKKSYSFIAKATDEAGNSATQVVTINIIDVDDTAPVFASSSKVRIEENQKKAIVLIATDNNSTVVYSISGGDSAAFGLDASSGVVTFSQAPDYEVKNSYFFVARATDASGNYAEQNITIEIVDVLERVLKKTGQTKSYDGGSNVVSDHSVKDDGYYQAGTSVKYQRDSNKSIVVDTVRQLMWQDNEEIKHIMKRWLTEGNYGKCEDNSSSSACMNMAGDTAFLYCSTLTLGGYDDWRMPTVEELRDIVEYGKHRPAINEIFKSMPDNLSWTSRFFWSSTTVSGANTAAWPVEFDSGYIRYRTKNMPHHIRCVREYKER
jgi:hypothetical protein